MAQRKTFRHCNVQAIEMHNVDDPNGRYYVVDGIERKFRSVTTVIGEKTDKTALLEWKKRVGEEEAQKISTQAARRGTAVHSLAERYVLNEEDYLRDAMPSSIDSFKSLQPLLDKHVNNILGVELPLYSTALNTAGRTDLVAEFDGIPSIIDYKTSRKLKKEAWINNYFLQSTCYAMMFSHLYGIKIPQLAIMISVDNEDPQLFVKPVKNYVEEVIRIFRD